MQDHEVADLWEDVYKRQYQNRENCSKKEKQQVEKTKEQQSKAEKSENSDEPHAARDHSSEWVDHNKSGQWKWMEYWGLFT